MEGPQSLFGHVAVRNKDVFQSLHRGQPGDIQGVFKIDRGFRIGVGDGSAPAFFAWATICSGLTSSPRRASDPGASAKFRSSGRNRSGNCIPPWRWKKTGSRGQNETGVFSQWGPHSGRSVAGTPTEKSVPSRFSRTPQIPRLSFARCGSDGCRGRTPLFYPVISDKASLPS